MSKDLFLELGDIIKINLNTKRVDVKLTKKEIEKRKKIQKITKPPNQTPWQEIYRNLTGQLSEGACLNLEDKYFQISKTKGIPRDSH